MIDIIILVILGYGALIFNTQSGCLFICVTIFLYNIYLGLTQDSLSHYICEMSP